MSLVKLAKDNECWSLTKHDEYVELKVLSVVTIKSIVFWVVSRCCLEEVTHISKKYTFHLQVQRASQVSYKQNAGRSRLVACLFFE
jgi:hypothetical protein